MRFDQIVRDSRPPALFLDLDGTLIEIAPTPDGVAPPGELVPLLQRLVAALSGAVAILSGRRLAQIDELLFPLALVGAGTHGAEMRLEPAGKICSTMMPIRAAIKEAVGKLGAIDPGIIVEPKDYSIAVHYRLAPAAGPRIDAALRAIAAREPEVFAVGKGRMVRELVPRQTSKGKALETLMRLPPFLGRRPIMIGDDVTDESALAAAERLGGSGLRVAGEHFPIAASDFTTPSDVRAWLSNLAGHWTERYETIA